MRPCFVTVIALTGSVGASTLRLSFAGCDYQGDLFHLPIDSAAGDVTSLRDSQLLIVTRTPLEVVELPAASRATAVSK